jgi:hypothetical protein
MAKSKKSKPNTPWCWYCEREFENEQILIQHQKSKHFKCPCCTRRLNSAHGMFIHAAQVHKETVKLIPNALPGRDDGNINVYGMEGIPVEDFLKHGNVSTNPVIANPGQMTSTSMSHQQIPILPIFNPIIPPINQIIIPNPIVPPPPPPLFLLSPTAPVQQPQIERSLPLTKAKLYFDDSLTAPTPYLSIEEQRAHLPRYTRIP